MLVLKQKIIIKRNKMRKSLLLGLFVAIIHTGCAFKDQKLELEYTSNGEKGSETGIVCLNKFSDERVAKHRIGIVKNGMGMETANIITDQDITFLISDAIHIEMKNLGYQVNLIDVKYSKFMRYKSRCYLRLYCQKELEVIFEDTGKNFVKINWEEIIW